jgi:hypothetical protein
MDVLLNAIQAFGDDIELAPKKGYPSLRRRKQFAMIQPSAAGRIDLGLILRDVPPDARLESAKGFNALFTHRARLSSTADIDPQLTAWLQRAYDYACRETMSTAPYGRDIAERVTRRLHLHAECPPMGAFAVKRACCPDPVTW